MKKILLTTLLVSVISCSTLQSKYSSYDPYRYKKLEEKNIVFKEEIVIPQEKPKEEMQNKEIKPIEEKVNNYFPVTVSKPETVVIEKVTLTKNEIEVLKLLKQIYGLVESIEVMEEKTVYCVEQIREKTKKNVDTKDVLNKITKIIREMGTNSYALAITRAIETW